MPIRSMFLAIILGASVVGSHAQAASANQVVGTWRMVSAQVDPEGRNLPAYGQRPNGMLVFTPDMHFIEVLTDADNRTAMSRSIGFFGTYTVDETGEFSGNRVEGATFPNWVGDTRTRRELTLKVSGDQMTEHFQRPDGTRIVIEWQRVR